MANLVLSVENMAKLKLAVGKIEKLGVVQFVAEPGKVFCGRDGEYIVRVDASGDRETVSADVDISIIGTANNAEMLCDEERGLYLKSENDGFVHLSSVVKNENPFSCKVLGKELMRIPASSLLTIKSVYRSAWCKNWYDYGYQDIYFCAEGGKSYIVYPTPAMTTVCKTSNLDLDYCYAYPIETLALLSPVFYGVSSYFSLYDDGTLVCSKRGRDLSIFLKTAIRKDFSKKGFRKLALEILSVGGKPSLSITSGFIDRVDEFITEAEVPTDSALKFITSNGSCDVYLVGLEHLGPVATVLGSVCTQKTLLWPMFKKAISAVADENVCLNFIDKCAVVSSGNRFVGISYLEGAV